MRAYFCFWRYCLNFKGITSRRDFWVAGILFNLFGTLIHFTETLTLALKYEIPAEQAAQGPIFMVYGCIGLVAFISMCVRRLRDGGYLDKTTWKFLIPIIGLARLAWCLYFEESATVNNHA